MSAEPTEPRIPAPPGEIFAPERLDISRRQAWIVVVCFLLFIGLPPLFQDIREWKKGDDGWLPAREFTKAVSGSESPDLSIEHRLRAFDSGIARLDFTKAPRQWSQQVVTSILMRGNDRTFPGRDGWLFYRPELQALTGYGPVVPEPHSVSRDPALLDWEPPLEPIRDFATALKDRGVALWLVPAPMKPSIYPEKLSGTPAAGPVRHRDTAKFYEMLSSTGLRVVDPAQILWDAKSTDATEGPVYLPNDTHWTPRGMVRVADMLSVLIRAEPWFGSLPPSPELSGKSAQVVKSLSGFGDLVEKLGTRNPDRLFQPYQIDLRRWPVPGADGNPDKKAGNVVSKNSPIVLLGDSFVNIFDDPTLGFAASDAASGTRTGAGLASHLAHALGQPLDVHAVNGDGASGVRRWLANRGESVVRSKKLVLWVIAERDLMLSRSLAKSNSVFWKHTPIAADAPVSTGEGTLAAGPSVPGSADGVTIVEARVLEKSEQADPAKENYPNSLYTIKYEIVRTLSGAAASSPMEVAHWNFKNRVVEADARIRVGGVYRLELKPWASQAELQSINLEIISDAGPAWFAAKTELVTAP